MRRALPWVVAAMGLALLVTGVALYATGDRARPSAMGWFAYEPLPLEVAYESRLSLTYDDGDVLWAHEQLVGAVVAVLGLLALTAVGGWAVGRRTARRDRHGA